MAVVGLGMKPNDDIYVAIYDPSKKELIKTFDTLKKASVFLGIGESTVKKACISKKRKYSPKLDMEVAIRLKGKGS